MQLSINARSGGILAYAAGLCSVASDRGMEARSTHARQRRTVVYCSSAGRDPLSPTPKTFQPDPRKVVDLARAAAGFVFRGTSGAVVAGYELQLVDDVEGSAQTYSVARFNGKKTQESSAVIASWPRPAQPLELYEFQACPFCKRVREGATYFDLDTVIYPCPRDGPTWRPKAIALGGKAQFPLLRDPNTGTVMYESNDILKYMAEKYGDGAVPSGLSSGVAPILCGLALLPRAGNGGKYRRSKVTEATKPLIFWAYEASPFCILVREVLTELEIPHIVRTAARGSPKRQELLAEQGLFQVPFLVDPNTGRSMFESSYMMEYLESTYAA